MELRAEIADETLAETARNTKFIMKNALRCLGFGYLIIVIYVIDGISKYKTESGDLKLSFKWAIIAIITIYAISTVLGGLYQFKFLERRTQT